MANEIKGGGQSQVFDYKQVDEQTADFLKECANEIEETLGQAATRIGGILKKAQDRLAKNGYGCFRKWLEYEGYGVSKAYELIRQYELIVHNAHKRKLIEELPTSLVREVARPSAESTPEKAQAKAEVLAGEIDTLKAYKERIAQLEIENEQLAKKADKPPEIRTEYIEVDNTPDDYEQLKKEKEELARRLAEIPETKQTQENERPYGVKLGVEMYEALSELSDWQKKYSWIITDVGEFSRLAEADPNFRREFNRLNEFWRQMNEAVNRNKGTAVFEADYEIIN